MPVIKVIQVDNFRCEVFADSEGKANIHISPTDDPGGIQGGFMSMDLDDFAEFVKMCKDTLKRMRNA